MNEYYPQSRVIDTLREKLCCSADILYVLDPKHLWLAQCWIQNKRHIYVSPLLANNCISETCVLHKQLNPNLFCTC